MVLSPARRLSLLVLLVILPSLLAVAKKEPPKKDEMLAGSGSKKKPLEMEEMVQRERLLGKIVKQSGKIVKKSKCSKPRKKCNPKKGVECLEKDTQKTCRKDRKCCWNNIKKECVNACRGAELFQ